VLAFLHETYFEFDLPVVLIVGHASPEVLSQATHVSPSSCFQRPLQMESLLDRVGLAMAQIDIRNNGQPGTGCGRPGRFDEAEICILPTN
jgi:hypothetical protein